MPKTLTIYEPTRAEKTANRYSAHVITSQKRRSVPKATTRRTPPFSICTRARLRFLPRQPPRRQIGSLWLSNRPCFLASNVEKRRRRTESRLNGSPSMGCGASVKIADSKASLVERGVDEALLTPYESCSLSNVVGHLDETLKLALNVHRPSMEAETQTKTWRQATAAGKRDPSKAEVSFGPLKLLQPTMQILLVFPREDSQSDAFWWAAERGGYPCDIACSRSSAEMCFLQRHHELVIIDLRHSESSLDGEEVCRSLRATRQSEYMVVLGLANNSVDAQRLLSNGFNRILMEALDISVCLTELMTLERGEVRSQFQLLTSSVFVHAIENCFDGVEITTEEAVYQYVNPAFEKMTGYKKDELIGRTPKEMVKSDRNIPSVIENMDSQLRSGKDWQGRLFGRKKTGEDFPEDARVLPVFAPSGKIIHNVGVKKDISQQVEAYTNLRQAARSIAQVQEELHHSPLINHKNGRRGPKIKSPSRSPASSTSVASEIPIAKVMTMLNKAQEQSPHPVVQSLDRVMELLRSSELYLPWQTSAMLEDDPRTRDFVGGLMGPSRHKLLTASSADVQDDKKVAAKPGGGCALEVCAAQLMPLANASPEMRAVLEGEVCWNFDVINLERVTEKRPLYWLGQQIFSRLSLCELLNIPESTLMHWLWLIEANYHSENTYHNSTHAADVLHSAACFLERPKVKAIFDPLDVVSVLVAAIIHDVDHPGKTNSFLCASGDPLAVLYNDTAVLESHHAAFAFKITTSNEKCNIFKGISPTNYRTVRQSVIDMVLATDMTKHFECLKKFDNLVKPTLDGVEPQPGNVHEFKMAAKRLLIKSADIANPARPRKLCQTWAYRIAQEYFDQTDEEKRLGLPLNLPVFDRTTCNIPKSQVQFIEYFVLDLFAAWDEFAEIPETMKHLNMNYESWKEEASQEERSRKRSTDVGSSRKTGSSDVSLPVEEVS